MSAMRMYTFRDSLNISPVESSWTPPPSPQPLFKDANITVYGIPILPSSGSSKATFDATLESPSDLSKAGQKRKREASPELPEKRIALDNVDSPTHKGAKRPAAPSPELLEGEAADEWRRQMIKVMFPGTRAKPEKVRRDRDDPNAPPYEGKGKRKGKGAEGSTTPSKASTPSESPSPPQATANVDTYRRARLPAGFHSQLPKFVRHDPASPLESPATPTLAYVIVGPRIRGKFDAKAAEALGVPQGPLRAQLTKGKSITVKTMVDGEPVEETVRPEDVIGESESPGDQVVLIFDIPTVMHIPALITSFEDPFYAKFRSHCPEDFKEHAHAISSREYSPDPVTFTSAAFSQLRMNQLDPDIFPMPHYSRSPNHNLKAISNLPENSHILTAGQEFNMRLACPPALSKITDSFHKTVTSDKPPVLPPKTSNLFTQARKDVEEHITAGKLRVPIGANVKIIPLGTGSAVPSKYRNVSSTLIQVPEWGNILLDSGEGTWGQLVRQFGLDDATPNNVWDMLRNLKCIYVSHVHGDHHMGLAQILAKRRQLNPPPTSPLYLVTIRSVHLYIRELSEIQDLGLDDPSGNGVIPIMSESLHWKNTGVYQTYGMWQVGGSEPWTDIEMSKKNSSALREALGLESFNTVDVLHKTRCYGVVIRHTDGWSIVFSGDTAPTYSLANAGKDATLLIHEATMADDQEEMAVQKAHSTFGQALDIGKRMRAEHVLLTHFSARYPKMPPSALRRPANGDFRPIVALAFDHANFKIGDMWKASYYLRALEQSFKETVAEEGDEEEDADTLASMDVSVD
ncbi:hypothetical protein DXG01_000823 [Tephrocybe rancida]|nr:hypothetical protein DXG01_000823 [Tephrocybe rancida]